MMQQLAILFAFGAVFVYGCLIWSFRPRIPRGCWFLITGLVLNAAQKFTLLKYFAVGGGFLDAHLLPMLEALAYMLAAIFLLHQHVALEKLLTRLSQEGGRE